MGEAHRIELRLPITRIRPETMFNDVVEVDLTPLLRSCLLDEVAAVARLWWLRYKKRPRRSIHPGHYLGLMCGLLAERLFEELLNYLGVAYWRDDPLLEATARPDFYVPGVGGIDVKASMPFKRDFLMIRAVGGRGWDYAVLARYEPTQPREVRDSHLALYGRAEDEEIFEDARKIFASIRKSFFVGYVRREELEKRPLADVCDEKRWIIQLRPRDQLLRPMGEFIKLLLERGVRL